MPRPSKSAAKKPAPEPSQPTPKKPKPAPVVVVEPVLNAPTARAFGDPAPLAPEPVVAPAPDGPIHRAPCDPPSRT